MIVSTSDNTRVPFVLVSLAAAILPLAILTATVTRLHRHHLETLAAAWSARADEAFDAGRTEESVADFRNALMYGHEDRALRLRLAHALIAAGRLAEARDYLLTLWNDQPGNGAVNRELGRIFAVDGALDEVVRYYHAAVEGAWDTDAERRRREARLELVDYLIAHAQPERARPDLVALASDLPDDPSARTGLAGRLAVAGLNAQAMTIYEQVIEASPTDADALAGAGELAFRSGQYPVAARYLQRAISHGASSPDVRRDAEAARLVLELDPFQRRLGLSARASRTDRAFAIARRRLADCVTTHPDSARLAAVTPDAALSSRALSRSLVRHPDDVDVVMDTVFAMETATTEICGEATGPDRALSLLAATRRAER